MAFNFLLVRNLLSVIMALFEDGLDLIFIHRLMQAVYKLLTLLNPPDAISCGEINFF